MASEGRNVFHQDKKQETTEKAPHQLSSAWEGLETWPTMRGTHLQHSPHRLNGVFNRIAGMVQPPPPRHTAHKPNCDVIQSGLPDTVTYHNGPFPIVGGGVEVTVPQF
ncbi:hypothetical protein AAG570_006046 [Ranatra chinensis]|uniref:Uncharacterized protein n=1 Tax=Ranatra chinensis TaxID=642074 RepID=A0ABD0XWW3_9HEMI